MGSILSYFIVLSLISIIYFQGLTELCHFPFKIQILQETILHWSCGDCCRNNKTWLQSKHNYAFRDLWNCWTTFRSRQLYKQLYRNWKTTLTYPTSRHYYQVRSRTFEPGDLNTFTIVALTLKEHDLIKRKSRKRGEFSTISLRCNTANISRGWWKWIFLKFPWRVRLKGHKKVGGAFLLLSSVSVDIPLVSGNLNVIKTIMYTDLLRHYLY